MPPLFDTQSLPGGFRRSPVLSGPLDWRFSAGDAAAALIVVDNERFLLQHRDRMDGIIYPEHWGCFGGGLDAGESAEEALRRELAEELDLAVDRATYFTAVDYDFRFCGKGISKRAYYVVDISAEQREGLTLGEGQGMADFTAAEVMALDRLMPFDGFALWLYIHRAEMAR
jgi:8-oxo-dGTP pyrophosphatase MutT (NUDIX family)